MIYAWESILWKISKKIDFKMYLKYILIRIGARLEVANEYL